MPRLHPAVIDANRGKIERVALKLFCAQGFHGTSMREIADRSRVSLGNIYNYYKTKDELFTSIVGHYGEVMNRERQGLLDAVDDPFHPEQIKRLARRIRAVVNRHADFWLLMYVDVTEFQNRHFRQFFFGMTKVFRARYAKQFADRRLRKSLGHLDPALVFTALWMQFFNYFLVEQLFRGSQHFGISDEQVIEALTALYKRAIRP